VFLDRLGAESVSYWGVLCHAYSNAIRTEMAGLQSLPIELLQEIISLVACGNPLSSRRLTLREAKALCDIRCICQLTNTVAEPMLFRHLVISINAADLQSPCHTRLRDLAEGSTNASIHTQALSIHLYNDTSECDAIPYRENLALALESLPNLNSVM
jgi:hypothetical protein